MIQKYLSNHKIVSLIQHNNCNKKVDNYKPYFGVFQIVTYDRKTLFESKFQCHIRLSNIPLSINMCESEWLIQITILY